MLPGERSRERAGLECPQPALGPGSPPARGWRRWFGSGDPGPDPGCDFMPYRAFVWDPGLCRGDGYGV